MIPDGLSLATLGLLTGDSATAPYGLASWGAVSAELAASEVPLSLAPLLTRLRVLIGDPAGDTQTWSDVQLQEFLLARATQYSGLALTGEATHPGGTLSYLTFHAPWGDWQEGATFYASGWTAITPSVSNYLAGRWTFSTEPTGQAVYITGTRHDMYGTAADVLEAWAATLTDLVDQADAGGWSMKLSQLIKNKLDLAARYRLRAGETPLMQREVVTPLYGFGFAVASGRRGQ